MHLFLHIGPHKTGSTYIQQTLAHNAEALGRSGIIYPQAGRPTKQYAHHDLVYRFDAFVEEGGFDQWRDEIAAAGNINRVVVSAEGLCNARIPTFEAIADAVGADEVTVIYYLRDPYSQFYSYWKEWVKQGFGHSLPAWFIEQFRDPDGTYILSALIQLDYLKGLDARFSMKICSYDGLLAMKRDIVEPIWCDLLGLDLPFEIYHSRPNQALSIDMTEFLRILILRYQEAAPNADGPSIRTLFTESFKREENLFDHDMVPVAAEAMRTHLHPQRKNLKLSRDVSFYARQESRLLSEFGDAMFAGAAAGTLFPKEPISMPYYDRVDLMSSDPVRQLIDRYVADIRATGRVGETLAAARRGIA